MANTDNRYQSQKEQIGIITIAELAPIPRRFRNSRLSRFFLGIIYV
ncbi:MAG: hypothetical protein IJ897_01150 [Prevotella sp.]|nr:hypothetical protein [Prevotella sp.]